MTQPTLHLLVACVALLGVGEWASGGESVYTDGNGRMSGITCDGERVVLESDVVIARPDWLGMVSMAPWCVSDVQYAETNGMRRWTGRIRVDRDRACRYQQTLEEVDGQANAALSVTAEVDVPIEGVYLFLRLPVETFAGGTVEARTTNDRPVCAGMPRDKPAQPHFLSATTDRVTAADASRRTRVEFSFDRPRPVTLQDEREWNSATYALFTRLSTNSVLRKGNTVSIGFSVKAAVKADHAAVRLTVDRRRLYALDGFGGNFVYGIQSPVTRFNLDSLRIAWARTQMNLVDWEPENDNDSATNTNWEVLEGRDVPGSALRHEFVLTQELQKKGIPRIVSVWDLPEWLYVDPGRGPGVYGRRIADDRWEELLESIGSYLLYAKRKYGVEPDLFSFNECREGVRVLLSAEEHRDAIKRIGAHFERLGLKTAMLLADNGSPRGTHLYAIPATEDPEAMRYVGALSMHSWGGATPEEYAAWNDLSKRIQKPLLVAELGVDADAWHTPWVFRTFDYALRELRLYQDILLYVRPQGTLEWELTDDYGIADVQKEGNGIVTVVPGWRYSFMKHFCNLTPARAQALVTRSSSSNVLFTAFTGREGDMEIYTLHIANLGASRMATLSGLPREVRQLRAIVTSERDMFIEKEPVPVRRGKLSVDLPAQSLLTLTTAR